MIRKLIAAAALALTAPALAAEDMPDVRIILVGNLLTDAASNPSGPATITTSGGKITDIAQGWTAPSAPEPHVTVIDLKDKTVLPGLIDLHVHLTGDPGGDFWKRAVEPTEWGVVVGAKNARLTAKAGFTTVREAGSSQYSAFSLRRGTAEGKIPGPRIVAAGPALAIVGGHGDTTGFKEDINEALSSGYSCTGTNECAMKVRRASRAGSDIIERKRVVEGQRVDEW